MASRWGATISRSSVRKSREDWKGRWLAIGGAGRKEEAADPEMAFGPSPAPSLPFACALTTLR